MRCQHKLLILSAVLFLLAAAPPATRTSAESAEPRPRNVLPSSQPQADSVRRAVEELTAAFGSRYPRGPKYLAELAALEPALASGDQAALTQLRQLRRKALLDNPLVDFDQLVVLKRKRGQLGLPTNHQCNTCLPQSGYDNELAILWLSQPNRLTTLYRPDADWFVGEMDLNFAGDRLLFTMPNGRTWQIHEIGVDGTGLRQVSREVPDVDNFDACYLPDGRIVFASTAYFTGVPCWHGRERACCLYLMNADGTGMRQLCFDQDHDLHPAVLANGQVVYSRWDYTGIMHPYLRPLMVMNPDGTLQRSIYGSNSYYPNSLFFPRAIPGAPTKLVAILSGYHGTNRTGELVVLDTARGWHDADGIIERIADFGEPIVPEVRDNLVGNRWPQFLQPYPLSDKFFVVAAQLQPKGAWGIYLADVFDNMLPLLTDPQYDFFAPLPLKATVRPPVIPDRVDLDSEEATVYLHDVYAGPGLRGVPRGAVKRLRVVAYHFGFPGMAGPDKIGRSGPWEAIRVLGTVPVHEDGSVSFQVPACTPISLQPLDDQGQALALMRSWYTAMPGESASCVGCHESPNDTPIARSDLAAARPPVAIEPWYGPARGFDFEREVQPVLDKYCVACHDGQQRGGQVALPDLRDETFFPDYQGLPLSRLGATRLDPELRQLSDKFAPCVSDHKLIGNLTTLYTPAYEALIPYIRRVNVEDYVGLHVAGEYHANTSELIQLLTKGHYGVQLDRESWERLVTWIDLNGPCHGTWNDVAPIPRQVDQRRWELAQQYGGARHNPEEDRFLPRAVLGPPAPTAFPDLTRRPVPLSVAGWPFSPDEAQRRQRQTPRWQMTVPFPGGQLRLVRIPAGAFVMGSTDGDADESPQAAVQIHQDYWMSVCEITNEQYHAFDPQHDSGYFTKRSLSVDGPGIAMNGPQQPVVRVSWQRAMKYCDWLSQQTGIPFTLPTEAEWEYACRAGSAEDLHYGPRQEDFSARANLADASLARIYDTTGGVVVLQDLLSDQRHDDGAIATADVARYAPNAWGLFDMHGNAAEWTASDYRPYPYHDSAPDAEDSQGQKVVRGGSFFDRPQRARSAFRLRYPAWQQVHNVGFRVVAREADGASTVSRNNP